MHYYLDTEFDGFGGDLLSLALVREDGASLYLIAAGIEPDTLTPWVAENVYPLLHQSEVPAHVVPLEHFGQHIARFIAGDADAMIITDWPDDVRYFCERLITGPGKMVATPRSLSLGICRVDAYPTPLPGAVQHNAWWDAMALRHLAQASPRACSPIS